MYIEVVTELVNKEINQLNLDGHIDDNTCNYLRVQDDNKAGRFYLLPKIHKKGNPGRPVVSSCGTPTEKISELVDYHLQPLVKNIPSYIKDTNDFLIKLKNLGQLPDNAILVTLDVVGLYPNIPHEGGLEGVREALDTRDRPTIPTDNLVSLVEMVLKNNILEFDGKFYRQIQGTAIGTKMAPTYANLFMAKLERELLANASIKPYLWLRYIDDVFLIWTGNEEELKHFVTYLNGSQYTTIQFTCESSKTNINFLDVMVINNDGCIQTDLYVKPTDKHQYLHITSCHPNGCKRGIPYSQALRLRRICSTSQFFERRCKDLETFLVNRGYKKKDVKLQINRARRTKRGELLKCTKKKTNRRIPLVVTYHPGLPNLPGILRDLQPVLHSSDRCKKAAPEIPMVAYRRPKSLKDYLVKAKICNNVDKNRCNRGVRKCGDKRCTVCNYLELGRYFSSTVTGRKFSINYDLHCNSFNVVYLITCNVCGIQYVGSTTTKFRLRFNNHRSRMRKHLNLSIQNKLTDDIIYRHFGGPGHHGLDSMSVQIIDRVNKQEDLVNKEGQWAYRLKTICPNGLNEDDFFFSQNTKIRKRV